MSMCKKKVILLLAFKDVSQRDENPSFEYCLRNWKIVFFYQLIKTMVEPNFQPVAPWRFSSWVNFSHLHRDWSGWQPHRHIYVFFFSYFFSKKLDWTLPQKGKSVCERSVILIDNTFNIQKEQKVGVIPLWVVKRNRMVNCFLCQHTVFFQSNKSHLFFHITAM